MLVLVVIRIYIWIVIFFSSRRRHTSCALVAGVQTCALPISKPGVFVPRDSTEFLAEQAVRRLRGRRRAIALDLATGGGTVALAVANETRGVKIGRASCRERVCQ